MHQTLRFTHFLMSLNLKDTLNLPKTDFPMKASLVEREPLRIEHWEKQGMVSRIRASRSGRETFILHDGPPFANGDIHMGHVLNKVLKDIVVRYKTMKGYDAPYVTGWDCHGLPIEHAVTKSMRNGGDDLDPLSVRRQCHQFAERFVGIQKDQFRRLGILTDWDTIYRTIDPTYEAEILRTFAAFVERGMVYRSKKPVYWSIPCRTALAEAEVEYQDHESPSIWVAFEAVEPEAFGLPASTSIVIWTTTPWTIPANLAIALHPRHAYTWVKHEGHHYLVAKELAESFIQDCGWDPASVSIADASIPGANLEGLKTRHPFIDRFSPVVNAEYVTLDSGTGCVHTAPGHGLEDYQTGLNYGLEIYCPLDDNGCYMDDGQIPAALIGKTVLESEGKNPANQAVLAILKEKGALLKVKALNHQYPHCWRSKTPVVFRAMDQFFMRLDLEGMRSKVLDEIESVRWIPEWGKNRIRGAVENRPDWCISRQRAWGVPLPVFFNPDGEALLDAGVIRGLAEKVALQGTDIWFSQSAQELLEGIALPTGWTADNLSKGRDTLDVWFDSGSSHLAVLDHYANLRWPADLYLEGSDQHRGWFQSSIWTSVLVKGKAPYRQVLTHGFVVDEDGKKLSKSQGSKTATQWLGEYGADILRLLIASEDYRGDLPIGETIIKQVSGIYRLIRNTLRFQLGNLFDFNPDQDAVETGQLHVLDKWILHETHALMVAVGEAFDSYDFPKVYQLIQVFCSSTLSATYHDIIKDRLYTLAPSDPLRRSSQTAIRLVFEALIRILHPILPFTTDEAYAHLQSGSDFAELSLVLSDWPTPDPSWIQTDAHNAIQSILQFKTEHVNDKLEACRQKKEIGQSLEAAVHLLLPHDHPAKPVLEKYSSDLSELFIVSQVKWGDPKQDHMVEVAHASGVRCPRSWRWVDELHLTAHWGSVSLRDKAVHDTLFPQS